jgi:hypothetical protein
MGVVGSKVRDSKTKVNKENSETLRLRLQRRQQKII